MSYQCASQVSPIQRVLGRLRRVLRSGAGFSAACPGHDDGRNSLFVTEGKDGRVLLHCFAGCTFEQIVKGLGLTEADMFQSRRKGGGGLPHSPRRTARLQEPQGLTLAHYAAAKKLPVSFLKSLGLTDIYFDGRPAVRIPYLGVEGFDAAVQFRLSMDGEDRFRWKTGSKPCLYGLWKLEEARAAGYICLVEGSSDSHTLWQHGIPALGLPGATTWREEWSNHLRGIETIYVMIEPDKGGEAVKRWLSSSEIRHRARLVTLVGAKDPSAMYLSDPEGFKGKWVAALASSVPWHKVERAEEIARAKALWAQCESLAVQPNILDLFEAALSRIFVVGERRTARLMYLALTSRFLDRPVSIATKGPSGCGKSYLAEKVLIFFPQSAYHVLTAMSEKALAYSSEPLKHRFVVILEATGLQGEWVSYFVRSLLSEDRICYETVEKTKDGLRPRRIEREGPTGLITTTTAVSLHPENETRFFSVEVDDSPDQTRKVLKAAAERINQDDTAIGDEEIGRFLAFQEWLAAANHRVVIPYASALAEQIPPVAVRLRRDFKAILSLIQAHAIVHQASRKQDDRGRIIATFEDYRAVRDIVSDIVSDGVQLTTSQATRQTVEAVREANERGSRCEEDGASVKEVADSLKLDVSTASRRVKVCLKNGYLRNLESRRGRPYKLVVGDSLPGEMLLLPDAESLARCCSVAASPEDGAPPPPSREPPGPDGVSPEIEEEL